MLQKYVALALNTHTGIIRSYTIPDISAEKKTEFSSYTMWYNVDGLESLASPMHNYLRKSINYQATNELCWHSSPQKLPYAMDHVELKVDPVATGLP